MTDTQTKPEIHFLILPSLEYGKRIRVILALLGIGLVLQLTVHVLIGWLLVLAASLFGIMLGMSTQPVVSGRTEWQTTTIDEMQSIKRLSSKIDYAKSRTAIFSMTSANGCGASIAAVLVLVISALVIAHGIDGMGLEYALLGRSMVTVLHGGPLSSVWLVDGFTLLIPLFLAGQMSLWSPPDITQKCDFMLDIYHQFKSVPELEFLPSVQVSDSGEKRVPQDCRMLVKIKDAPDDFIGIQVQVSMNEVQSKKYPYCYSVILAKKNFSLAEHAEPFLLPPDDGGFLGLGKMFKSKQEREEMAFHRYMGAVVELDSTADVDVIVVRQVTVGTGYTTSLFGASDVFKAALSLAQTILGKKRDTGAHGSTPVS